MLRAPPQFDEHGTCRSALDRTRECQRFYRRRAGRLQLATRKLTRFTDNILRVGVNYRFGGPLAAKY
jgi:hypothetical protein